MADFYVNGQQLNIARVSSGTPTRARATLDGTLFTAPWYQALALEGTCYGVEFGATALGASDPATFGAGGVDLDEFDMLVSLPASGIGLIPLYFHGIFEAIGTIAALDVFVAYGAGGVIGANSVSVTPHNLKPDSGNTSSCTCTTAGDDGGTAITLTGAIYRAGGTYVTAAAGDLPRTDFEWSVASGGVAPVIVGASRQVAAWLSAQASTGFIHFQWAELPSSALS